PAALAGGAGDAAAVQLVDQSAERASLGVEVEDQADDFGLVGVMGPVGAEAVVGTTAQEPSRFGHRDQPGGHAAGQGGGLGGGLILLDGHHQETDQVVPRDRSLFHGVQFDARVP